MSTPQQTTVNGLGEPVKNVAKGTDETHVGASKLGTGADRIRAALNRGNINEAQLVEATKISPMVIDAFKAGRAVTDEQLDMITAFVRGDYGMSGIDQTWQRKGFAAPEVIPLGPIMRDLPTMAPIGDRIETPKPQPQAAPVLLASPVLGAKNVPGDAMPTLPDEKPVSAFSIFKSRRSA